MHQSVSSAHIPVCGLCFFSSSIPAKPLCDLSLDVGQKGKIVNIPPAPLHHHQQLAVDISPLGSCGRGQWNSRLLEKAFQIFHSPPSGQ